MFYSLALAAMIHAQTPPGTLFWSFGPRIATLTARMDSLTSNGDCVLQALGHAAAGARIRVVVFALGHGWFWNSTLEAFDAAADAKGHWETDWGIL